MAVSGSALSILFGIPSGPGAVFRHLESLSLMSSGCSCGYLTTRRHVEIHTHSRTRTRCNTRLKRKKPVSRGRRTMKAKAPYL